MFIPHINLSPKNKRVFVLGDIHGQLHTFLKLLKKIKYEPKKDLLISTGDLIDRGEHSLELLMYFLNNPNIIVLAGNHEDLMVKSFSSRTDADYSRYVWERNGGRWNNEVDQKLLKRISQMMVEQFYYAVTITLPKGKTVGITHGDIIGDTWLGEKFDGLPEKELTKLLWSRERAKGNIGAAYNIKNIDYTVHGHTPRKNIDKYFNSIFIDTGAYKKDGGSLSVIELNKFSRTLDLHKSTTSVLTK